MHMLRKKSLCTIFFGTPCIESERFQLTDADWQMRRWADELMLMQDRLLVHLTDLSSPIWSSFTLVWKGKDSLRVSKLFFCSFFIPPWNSKLYHLEERNNGYKFKREMNVWGSRYRQSPAHNFLQATLICRSQCDQTYPGFCNERRVAYLWHRRIWFLHWDIRMLKWRTYTGRMCAL